MINIINDISTLTTIPEKTLNKLSKKAMFCICEAITEDMLSDNDITEAFIGIGTLYIKHSDNMIKYHFEPTDAFSKAVIQTTTSKINPLDSMLSDALHKKFNEVYKDLC